MLRRIIFLLLFLWIIPAFSASHRCVHQNLNDLVLAQWGGLWEEGKTTGYFRVLVYRTGWEHSHDVVQIEVMLRDEARKRIRVRHCTQVEDHASMPRVIQSASIREKTTTTADIQLLYQSAPFTSAPRVLHYSIDTNGTLSPKK